MRRIFRMARLRLPSRCQESTCYYIIGRRDKEKKQSLKVSLYEPRPSLGFSCLDGTHHLDTTADGVPPIYLDLLVLQALPTL